MSEGLRFKLSDVKENGEAPVDASVPAEEVGAVIECGELIGKVALKGQITQQDDEAAFDGSVRGQWRVECTRCLKPVEAEYSAPVEARAPIDGGPMDLTDDVRQAIVLAQPMKTYCKPDCKGFCPVCRQDRNVKDCGHKVEEPSRIRIVPPVDRHGRKK